MIQHTLQAAIRQETGRKTNALRAQDKIPAVVYGSGIEPMKILIDRVPFVKTYREVGESSLIELNVDDGTPLNVLIQDYQLDPVRDDVIHVDFRSVDMNKEIDAVVKLQIVGESPAVKALGGTLISSRDTVTMRSLPGKLVPHIDLDLSMLKTFDDVIRIEDLKVPEGATIVDDGNLTVAIVSRPRTAAEMAALDESPDEDVAAVEVEGEKVDGTEGADKATEGEKGAAGDKVEAKSDK